MTKHVVVVLACALAAFAFGETGLVGTVLTGLICGALVTLLFWAAPYALYLLARRRWRLTSDRQHLAITLVWLASMAAVFIAMGHRSEDYRELDAEMLSVSRAIQRYRGDHGRYPPSLNELVPRYLPRAPRVPESAPRRLQCPIAYDFTVYGAPFLNVPGRDPMFDSCIHRRGVDYNVDTGRRLQR